MGFTHTPSGRWRYGIVLSLFTALLWGTLPIGLKAMLFYMDAYSITWYRFLIAGTALLAVLLPRNGLPQLRGMSTPHAVLLAVACIGLCGNYILYMLGLDKTSPGAAQVVIQLAPVLLILGGTTLFGEALSRRQLSGLSLLLAGLALFFHHKLQSVVSSFNDYGMGVILILASAASWAAYALAQKQLLKAFSSPQILIIIYFSGVALFLPKATPSAILKLDTAGALLLAFCGANTLLAYGCFAEALEHLEASKISAVLAVIPLLTLAFMEPAVALWPERIAPEKLSWLSLSGAIVVVGGSVLVVMRNTPPAKPVQPTATISGRQS